MIVLWIMDTKFFLILLLLFSHFTITFFSGSPVQTAGVFSH